MARRYHMTTEGEIEPTLEIASLIDISFLLLIYFMVTSTLQPSEADLGMTLPSEVALPTAVTIDPFVISIDATGTITQNGEEIESDPNRRDLPELYERLKNHKSLSETTGDEQIVVIAAADDSLQQRFVDVANVLAELKISNVTITGFQDP